MKFEKNYSKTIFNYMKNLIKEYEWEYEITREQARCMLTTICLIDDIYVDTRIWDDMMRELYDECNIEDWENFDNFEMFMCEYLV